MTIANFTLATSDRTKDAQGNWQDHTEWHNLVAFQRTAEIVRDYCKKGSQIFVEGKIQTRSWEDKEGHKKYWTEILVNELSLLDGKPSGGEGGGSYAKSNTAPYTATGAAPAAAPDFADQGITDDDIPF
jgi:single-strand DNA-binding protein